MDGKKDTIAKEFFPHKNLSMQLIKYFFQQFSSILYVDNIFQV